MRNSRDHVSCALQLEVTYALKKINKNRSCSFSTHSTYLWTSIAEIDVELQKKFAASDCRD